jgi:hypothetical protein
MKNAHESIRKRKKISVLVNVYIVVTRFMDESCPIEQIHHVIHPSTEDYVGSLHMLTIFNCAAIKSINLSINQ